MIDPSGVKDASGVYNMYCMLCDEVINSKDLCPHQEIVIEHHLKAYVDLVNADINNKQKEAKSIQFYLVNSRAIREGQNVAPFNVLNVYGFKDFVLQRLQ